MFCASQFLKLLFALSVCFLLAGCPGGGSGESSTSTPGSAATNDASDTAASKDVLSAEGSAATGEGGAGAGSTSSDTGLPTVSGLMLSTGLSSHRVTREPRVGLQGRAVTDQSVSVFVNGRSLGSALVTDSGDWQFDHPWYIGSFCASSIISIIHHEATTM